MSETIFTLLEHRYRRMGELLLGSVRETSVRSWSWPHGEYACMYYADDQGNGGILSVFDKKADGGYTVKQFIFNRTELLRAVDLDLSKEQIESGIEWSSLMEMQMLEIKLNPEKVPTDDEQALFWECLQAPLPEYKA